jgi:ergothioneine biosynthesis protein EgtB
MRSQAREIDLPDAQPSAHADALPPLAERYAATRRLSEALITPLSEADAALQSMQDASPAKWHLAHTTWFFETFLLRDRVPGYRLFDERWPFLFNSYYEGEGDRIARARRGMLSRPTVEEICGWRAQVDEAIQPLFADPRCFALIELGIAHEQQHQELLLTDIKHAFFQNPLGPAMWEAAHSISPSPAVESWQSHPGGIALVGYSGEGFAFDNEGPAHRVLIEPFAIANRLVTIGEWENFVADGGYRTPALWLADGWDWVQRQAISAPLYWRDDEHFTHAGWRQRCREAPVSHISYYEADAFAAWRGLRLPTEFEWEVIAQRHDPAGGNQLDGAAPPLPTGSEGSFGDCWQFTRSAYLPYPRFHPAEGAVGEYNGKFMAGQWVLKGASCATPRGHSRASYRNFFYPRQRWQFTGLRLAKDI